MAHVIVERSINGRTLRLETGKWAKQAAGSVVVTMDETVVLATVVEQPMKPGMDFFPLTVDYREKGYAAGLIFGGRFMKREGRPSEKETLTMRLIDRPVRPLWPDGFIRDVLIQCIALSACPESDPDILAMIGAAASLSISSLPFQGPLGAVRVGMADGKFILFPTHEQIAASPLELVVAGTKGGVLMVEAGAQELTEEQMLEGIKFGHGFIQEICSMVEEMVAQVKPEKEVFVSPEQPALYQSLYEKHKADFKTAAYTPTKFGRHDARKALVKKLVEQYARKEATDESKPAESEVKGACDHAWEKTIRGMIVEGKRCDGRSQTEIRPISCEVGVLPRTHGSALFTRGETQALVTTTLGTASDEQIVESLMGEFKDRFLLHYNFPSFSVGEVKMPRGPGRREIGHGALARRGLKAMLPEYTDFPYTLRVVSEILESNGSSSMASVCGGTLALLDAGVPMKAPVAGIAMGLVEEGGQFAVVSDILGDEDHYGDMDFKVAGTAKGVTALQMDLKNMGIPYEVMQKALDQALEGRKHILNQMFQVMATHRDNISKHAPKIVQLKIAVDKIGKLIGPGGKTIRMLEEKHKVKIEVTDDGSVVVASPKRDQAEECAKVIEGITGTPEVGKVYHGEVVNIKEFGVFVEILPGVDGMCHVSELDTSYIKNPAEFCKVGDKIDVKLISVDDLGRLKLSRKALLVPAGEGGAPAPAGGGGGGGGGDRRGGGDRGDRRGPRRPRE
ncbi:MAG: polyribonucleotide nucleotidyltransferase [Planctomycetes bacterium]|nr:polyribonucleotide nucleotidyltransferase [Planctomycetota bacterium]